MTVPRFLPLYLGFAAAYLLSYLYRTVNAVISPELTSNLGVSASSLGLLTSAYFVGFAAMQLPAGCCSTASGRGASSRCCSRSRGSVRSPLALAWFAFGWRRHANAGSLASAAA